MFPYKEEVSRVAICAFAPDSEKSKVALATATGSLGSLMCAHGAQDVPIQRIL
jgi:hypothetical protein